MMFARPLLARPFLVLLAASALGLAPLPAFSQPAGQNPDPTLKAQVTVTAQRVEEALQDVPISLVAVSGEELEREAIFDIQDLPAKAPGLVISGQASSTGDIALYIRGIGSNTFGLGTESTVGFYVDGVYIPRPQGFLNQFLDVERIELLRGPQGTLWGRNSTGGAINLVTKSPGNRFHGRLFGELGQYDGPGSADSSRLSLSLDGPLTERVFGRLAATSYQADDFTLNQTLDRGGKNLDGVGLRGALAFLPSDAFSVTLRADRTDDSSHNNFDLKPGNISPISVLGTLQRFYQLPDITDPHRIAANIEPVSEYRESGLSAHAGFVLGSNGTTVESISSYRNFDSQRVADIDGTVLDFVETSGDFDVEWWSQEVQVRGATNNVDWIAGVYAFHEGGTTNVDTRTDLALFQVHFFAANPGLFLFDPRNFCSLGFLAPPSLCGIDYYRSVAPFLGLDLPGNKAIGNFFDTTLETDSRAAYGQATWRLTDRLSLTTGLRYTKDEKSHDQLSIDFATLMPVARSGRDDWSGLTPKLGLELRASDDVMFYGSLTTGWKSGGFNSISLQPSFDDEKVTSYEIGVKSTLADRKITLNAAAFHYDYDDLQVAVLYPDRSTVENAAKASANGFEIEATFRPYDRLVFQVGAAVLDDQFDEFSSQDPVEAAIAQDNLNAMGNFDPVAGFLAGASVPVRDLSGNGLPRAPDLTANVALEYGFDLGTAGVLTARAEYQYTDDIAFDPFERFVQSAYGLIHANLAWTPRDGHWSVNLYGRNLGNQDYRTSQIFARVTGSLEVWAPPSQVGLQVGFDF